MERFTTRRHVVSRYHHCRLLRVSSRQFCLLEATPARDYFSMQPWLSSFSFFCAVSLQSSYFMHHNQFVYDDGDDDDEMFNVRLLGNDRYHGNRVMTDMSGTWRDTTTKFSSKSVHLPFLIWPPFPSWIGILYFWTTHEVQYAVRLPCQNLVSIRSSLSEILRFYDFGSLAGKCLTTTPFGFWGFNPLKIVRYHQNPKRHILGGRVI